jgi:gliding motility-associated lipoprotein GldD
MLHRLAILSLLLTIVFVFTQCEDPVYTPKPRGFPKVEFPTDSTTKTFTASYCDFSFEYPAYMQIQQDSTFFDKTPVHPCWFDLYIPEFDSRLHCSYLPVGAQKSFDELRSDAFELANWHNKKANYIDEQLIQTRNGVEGIFFDFEGPVASRYQFFLTDTTRQHFLRAALYFNAQARPDSLAPMYDFLEKDIDRMIKTFRWN